ncbi:mannose-1-phosphate guanylyltransferase [Ornithinimicrobium faecis]|uniref:Sugar phosphate nucleotidyltransferase n=1 Tax=Ornithinimicrobium faecis TaxID=2934158 RepID=A0ABY4YZS9_9MICO|nr:MULTISPECIES: mannose-1-phosphate guanylyltransferase [unclassified Ornithinimicrobium]USQ82210.1 sugar phosphate nucleotidyltransferase [Ornithinimicrobium sp. HY1793]
MDHFWGVIPAGGAGTRLWPLSRRTSPKFLHDLTGSGRSLLQDTAARLEPLTAERLMVVTGVRHAAAVREQLPHLPADQVLVEPTPRDSMPAIGLAAAVLEARDPDAVIGSFAADHVIGDPAAFQECVREAVAAAATGALVTLGITPTYPATGFGYIKVGDPWPGARLARQATEFVEKPDRETAQSYLDSGAYRWNAGMFVVRAATLLDLLGRWHPELADALRQLAAEPATLDQVWPSLTKIAIDHAVAEPAASAGRVAVVPADFPWDDVGDFASLMSLLEADDGGLHVLGPRDQVVSVGSTGLVAAHSGRTVVTLGVDDIVVVDTPDALLVTTRERVQDVKGIVETLQQSGREDLT